MTRRAAAALLLAALACGAARAQEQGSRARPAPLIMGGLNLFSAVEGPMSFEAATPADVPKGAELLPGRLDARACQHGVSVPLTASFRATSVSAAAGNGGYKKALASLRAAHPEAKGFFDVISDIRTLIVLGIYKRTCVEVSARAWR